MVVKRKKNRGKAKRVSPALQEGKDSPDSPKEPGDEGAEDETEQDSEEGAEASAEVDGADDESETPDAVDSAQTSAHEEEKKSPPTLDWKVVSVDRPATHPQELVFKFSNNLKIVVPEAEFQRFLSSRSAKR